MKFIDIEWKGKRLKFWALREDRGKARGLWIHFKGRTWLWRSGGAALEAAAAAKEELSGRILARMPGQILKVCVKPGEKLKKGQTLLIMSAMKMEYSFRAEAAGAVREVSCRKGQQVEARQALMKIDYSGHE